MNEEAGKLLYFNRPKRFTLEEARKVVPQVLEITRKYVLDTKPLIEQLQDPDLEVEERERLSKELQEKIESWAAEIGRFGALAKGLWLVDFDSGAGYYCWRYNEETLSFFHSYDEGFTGRTPIQ